jgi:D-serine deaminase-like pyridoxal phosphate-dependent protein
MNLPPMGDSALFPARELDTPALLVDLDRLDANIQRMAAAARKAGVSLRPHCKTHKCPEIARMQIAAGAEGITVAKLSEAEMFADEGFDDIFIAYPIIGEHKLRRAARLGGQIRLIVGVDSFEGALGLVKACDREGVNVAVRVEVDLGLNRSGVAPDKAVDLVQNVIDLGLDLDGLYGYRGSGYPGATGTLAERGRQEADLLLGVAEACRARGIKIKHVSLGSTPTGIAAAQVPGITEIRPGTYVFHDNMQVAQNVCTPADVALTIAVTVVSRPAPDLATVDAGSKTLAGDIVPAGAGLTGYGQVVEIPGAYVARMSEEHGVIQLPPGAEVKIGDRLHLIPNHVCTAVNLSDVLYGVRDGQVETIWPVMARGMRG